MFRVAVSLAALVLVGCSPPEPKSSSASPTSLTADEQKQLDIVAYDVAIGCPPGNKELVADLHLPDAHLSDDKSALAYAIPIFERVFGAATIANEQPFRATKYEGKWVVTGTLPANTLGGTATMIIQPETGKVLCLEHFK